jgi:heme oxygenase
MRSCAAAATAAATTAARTVAVCHRTRRQFVTSPSAPLSTEIRARTAALHSQVEVALGLPGAIRTRHDYGAWLGRFLGLYAPLEHVLAAFPDWNSRNLALPSPSHSERLVSDLAALGVDPADLPRADSTLLPEMPTFAHALGVLYVLEGSTLGGRLILRDVQARLGTAIDGATGFLGGRGEMAGAMWRGFRAALDSFGNECPELRAEVVASAQCGFGAILDWFAPFRPAPFRPAPFRDPLFRSAPFRPATIGEP